MGRFNRKKFSITNWRQTIRERHKSAPFLRLKNSKSTSKCQVFFTVPKKPKSWTKLARRVPLARVPGALKGKPMGFFNISVAKHQKGNFFEKILNAEKNWKGPFSLVHYCVTRKKKEKPFWFSSLGQMVQFDTIKFHGTLYNNFGQFVRIEKSHYNSRVSLHEAPPKNRIYVPVKSTCSLNWQNCKL